MAIAKLSKAGIIKAIVSYNLDPLHRMSGVNPNILAELHGNVNLEKC